MLSRRASIGIFIDGSITRSGCIRLWANIVRARLKLPLKERACGMSFLRHKKSIVRGWQREP
jgi:hypothetical protein